MVAHDLDQAKRPALLKDNGYASSGFAGKLIAG